MDEESHSTSSNSREAVQMNTGVPLHIVNLREAHCVLCRTIYSPGSEANWHDDLNICQDCDVLLLEPFGFVRTFPDIRGMRRIRNRYSRILGRQQRVLERYLQDHEETRQVLEEARQRVEEARQRVGEVRQGWEEARQRVEEIRQRVERRLEELADISNSRGEAALLPTTLSSVDNLRRVIITEEHEMKHNGLVCAICIDPLSVGTIVNQLPCLHVFHPLCIVPWLKVRRSCPTCRYKLSLAFRSKMRQNSNRRMGFQEIVQEGFSVNSSSATSNVNEAEVVVSESHNETPDSSVRDREGSRGRWFLFAAAPIVSLVGIALVECFQNLLGDGRGRGSTGHVEFPRQCQQQVRMFSSGSSSTRTSNSRENT